MNYIIKNAYVVDPVNKISGEKMDIFVADGRITDEEPKNAEIIDAGGFLTLPGGVDSHTHICGTKVNFGRYMSPEDMRAGRAPRRNGMRAVSGYSIPTTYGNSYRYAQMGYTTLTEGAMAPLEARHTHEEFKNTPLQDGLILTLFDGDWGVMRAVAAGDINRAAALIAWRLDAVKGYGVKLTNPLGAEMWSWGKNVECMRKPIPEFDLSSAEYIKGVIEANEMLGLPHSVHIHCNNLGKPGNFTCTIGTMGLVPDLNEKRQTAYLTHVQFHSYGGTGWNDFCSKAEPVANMVNLRPQITIDMGQVMFGRTTTMTADGPMEFNLYRLHQDKWSNHDVEMETASGVIPVIYRRKNLVNSIMWAIGLELALLVKNPWQCMLTTDSPNGAPFVKYPEIIGLLMSKEYRDREFATIHPKTGSRVVLPALDRELTFEEIAVMTRAGQARALGLIERGKGHLGPGAEADIAIYPFRPDRIDPAKQYAEVIRGFAQTKYTMKSGVLISKDDTILADKQNRIFWCSPKVPEKYNMWKDPELIKTFENNYSIRMENYAVDEKYYLSGSVKIETETRL
ncbi:Formyltransferase/hydrolase complex Fhc subunit A [bioreactor metagenome]|uniref:Formyltransferase/hydrolase complex Fhc subunit A n=1 Tax=bioreactor metagenome TaxID=1076179 RepID=A0A644VF79_9ZZZZ|nr:formylmethanofuran dehydrogenase subunit A [Methanocorpusculum sp.]